MSRQIQEINSWPLQKPTSSILCGDQCLLRTPQQRWMIDSEQVRACMKNSRVGTQLPLYECGFFCWFILFCFAAVSFFSRLFYKRFIANVYTSEGKSYPRQCTSLQNCVILSLGRSARKVESGLK